MYLTFLIFRSIRFDFDQTTNVENVSGYRYKLGERLFSNATVVPENSCYNPSPAPDIVSSYTKF